MADSITPATLRFERLLDAPVEKVWQYLVDPELRARWFMAGPTELEVGGRFGLKMDHDNLSDEDVPTPERFRPYIGNSWEERITRYEPPHLLAITWDGGDAGEVTFALSDEGGKTLLTLTHTGLRGRDDAVNFGGGWHSHLAVLEKRIRGEAVPDFWALHGEAEQMVEKTLTQSGV
ncbi:MAG: SRPBCC family protein [Burkholderiaceae bacterium]